MQVEYAEIVTSKPVQRFLLKFYLSDIPIQSLILISPFVGTLEGTRVTLDGVCRKAVEKGIPTYVITRAPEEEYHQQAVGTLISYENVQRHVVRPRKPSILTLRCIANRITKVGTSS